MSRKFCKNFHFPLQEDMPLTPLHLQILNLISPENSFPEMQGIHTGSADQGMGVFQDYYSACLSGLLFHQETNHPVIMVRQKTALCW